MNSEIYEYAATNRLSAYILCSNIRYLVDFENMFLNKRARLRGGYDDPKFIDMLKQQGITVATGDFGAYMQVHLINDGPVTIMIDSKKIKFPSPLRGEG